MPAHSPTFNPYSSKPLFLKHRRWLDIALVLSDREGTMGECAHRLGLTVDMVRRQMLAMAKEGLLEADPWPAVRGTRFRLREDLVERAEEEARSGQREGSLVPTQVVLMVEVGRLLDLANALRDSDLTRSVVWLAKLNAGGGFLLVLDGKNTTAIATERLRGAVEAGGGSSRSGRVEEILSAPVWRRQLAAVRDVAL